MVGGSVQDFLVSFVIALLMGCTLVYLERKKIDVLRAATEDMAADEDFAKKYMFGLAMVLKKGLHINIIHDVERPMKDMMLGLENWFHCT